jgi:hypothetical protein
MASMEERNKTLVLEAFNTLFNKRDYEAALQFAPAAGMSPFGRCCRKKPCDKRVAGLFACLGRHDGDWANGSPELRCPLRNQPARLSWWRAE